MRFIVGVVAVGLCLVIGAPEEARACGNSTLGSAQSISAAVTEVKVLIDRGRHKQAVALLRGAFREPDELMETTGLPGNDQRLRARGHLALALIVARSRGTVALAPGIGGKRPAQREAAIGWAIKSMRWHLSGNIDTFELVCSPGKCRAVDDPERSAILAELLALRPGGRAEALEILRGLAKDDLMPSAQGWAVLAALQTQGGEVEAATLSASRCEQVAGEAAACKFVL
jgi:hypothetical protein